MDSIKHLDYYQCRACYASTNNLQLLTNLAESTLSQDAEKTYIQLLLEVCNINIIDDKPLGQWPQFICLDCSQKLKLAHDFIQQTHKINQLLKSIANLLVTKSEIDIIENPELDITLDIKIEKDEVEILSSERVFQYSPVETEVVKAESTLLPYGRWENCTRNNYTLREYKNNRTIEHDNTIEFFDNNETIEEDVEYMHNGYIINVSSIKPNSKPAFACSECNKSFTSTCKLNRHKRFNHVSRENKISCHICTSKFSRRDHLERHVKTVHKAKKDIKVPSTRNKQSKLIGVEDIKAPSTRNKQSKVIDVGGLTCDECEKTFNSRKKLSRHKRFVHIAEEQKIVCQICGNKFARKDHLKRHMERMHDTEFALPQKSPEKVNETRFNCDKCDRNYSRRCSLHKHEREAHDY